MKPRRKGLLQDLGEVFLSVQGLAINLFEFIKLGTGEGAEDDFCCVFPTIYSCRSTGQNSL